MKIKNKIKSEVCFPRDFGIINIKVFKILFVSLYTQIVP